MSGNDLLFWLHAALALACIVVAVRLWLTRERSARPALQRQVTVPAPVRQPTREPAKGPDRLSKGEDLRRVVAIVDRHRRRIIEMTTAQRDAARHLDAAEVALTRMLQEVGAVTGGRWSVRGA